MIVDMLRQALELHRNGGRQEAETLYRAILQRDAGYIPALINLGALRSDVGDLAGAEACFQQAMKTGAANPDLFYNYANLLRRLDRRAEAIPLYKRAVSARKNFTTALYNLALTYQELGDYAAAEDYYQHALASDPTLYDAYLNLGFVLEQQGRLSRAAEVYDKAIVLQPQRHEALSNLGVVQQALGQAAAAIKTFTTALARHPQDYRVASNILVAQQYHAAISGEELRRSADMFGGMFPLPAPIPAHDYDGSRPLRIGYVSADFCKHVAGLLARDIITRHDPSGFSVYFYSNLEVADGLTARFRAHGQWRTVANLPDDALYDLIRADEIDILVDLSGHTQGNRLPVFARRAAPVQISWLGYFATTGLPAMDFVIMDPVHAPAGAEKLFRERLIRLPHNRFCYTPLDFCPAVGSPPFLHNGHITFGSFNNTAKIGPQVLDVWARVLAAVPDSRLILKWRSFADPAFATDVRAVFARHGIADQRIELRGRSSHEQLLNEYAEIDIALDPFPFSGGYTSCEALWMGVPIITLPGERPVSRQTLSFLANIGLPGLAVADEDAYVALAANLARSKNTLIELRNSLRDRLRQSPLCDATGFIRQLEHAYRLAWQDAVTRTGNRNAAQRAHQVGLAAWQAGDYQQADQQMRHALALDASVAAYHANHGVVLKMLGVGKERIDAYRRAVALEPDNGLYRRNLASALNELKQFDEALLQAQKALEADQDSDESWYCFGAALMGLCRWREAAGIFNAIQARRPEWVPALLAAGLCSRSAGDPAKSVTFFSRALLHLPVDSAPSERANLLYNKALSLIHLHRSAEAEPLLREALSLVPDMLEALTDLGNVLKTLGRMDEALDAYTRSVTLRPDLAGTHCNLGTLYQTIGRYDEAIDCYQRALALRPDLGEAWSNLATCMTYSPRHGEQDILAAFQGFDRHVAQPLRDKRPFANDRTPGRRLRVGYVSADFRRHAVAYFALPLIEGHHRDQVEVFCYYSHLQVDSWTERFKQCADHWIECRHLSDAELAARIRADGIDILVDLGGHTGGNRILAFAHKPAPVQVTWMGYVTTTGLSAMDWRVTNHIADPPGSEAAYSERLWRLDGAMWCYRPLPNMPAPTPSPHLRKGHVTFGSLNRFSKNSAPVLEAWARILQAVPDARLTICIPEGRVRQELAAFFQARGVTPDRLIMFVGLDHQRFWELHADIDIALDPFPFGGGTTTCETLWLGVPLISVTGEKGQDFQPRFASRMGAAFLSSLGLSELVAPDVDRYVDIAVGLARDPDRLTRLRGEMRDRMARASLTDEERFAGQMEKAYRAMWIDWLEQDMPAATPSRTEV
jgi:predicted O-linked N-acetylglucosamine transferase (SPINDLY family)